MKTITVSDEMYEKLLELSTEINSQDHRMTCMPYFFQIQTTEQIAVAEGCGEQAWHMDGTVITTEKEIDGSIYEETNLSDVQIDKMSSDEKEEKLKELGWSEVFIDYKDFYQNAFLTAKACKEHIKKNHYKYENPVDFLSYASRNPELELIFQFLCGLTGGKLYK